MGIVVNTNSTAMFTNMYLGKSNEGTKESMQHLSSGYRINSAKDDAAGMQIADQLEAQSRGLTVALRNGGDALSVAQIAEGGMNEQTSILLRMNDLALQSANGSNGPQQREALDAEFAQLQDELSRIANTTSFGSQKLINGFYGTQAFQIGANAYETIDVTMVNASASALGFEYRTTVASDIDVIGGREDIALNHGDAIPQNEVPILEIKVDDDVNEIELDYSMTAQDLQDKINSIEGLSTATVSIAPDTGYERVNPANASHINDLAIATYPPQLDSSSTKTYDLSLTFTLSAVTANSGGNDGSLSMTIAGTEVKADDLVTLLSGGAGADDSDFDAVAAALVTAFDNTDLGDAGYSLQANGNAVTLTASSTTESDINGAIAWSGAATSNATTLKFNINGTDANDATAAYAIVYDSSGNTGGAVVSGDTSIDPEVKATTSSTDDDGGTTTYGVSELITIAPDAALTSSEGTVLSASWGGVDFAIDLNTTKANNTTDAAEQVQNVFEAWKSLADNPNNFDKGYTAEVQGSASNYTGLLLEYEGETEADAVTALWTLSGTGTSTDEGAYVVTVEDQINNINTATITTVAGGATAASALNNANALDLAVTETVAISGTLAASSVGASNNDPGKFADGSQADYGVEYDLSSYVKPSAVGGLKLTLNGVDLYTEVDLNTNVADASALVTAIVAGYNDESSNSSLANYELKANSSGDGIIILSKSPATGAKTDYAWELTAGTAPDGSLIILGTDLVSGATATAPSSVTMTGGATITGSPGPGLDADLTKYVDSSGGGSSGSGSAIDEAWAALGLTKQRGAQAMITDFNAASNATTPESIEMTVQITMVDGSTATATGVTIKGDDVTSDVTLVAKLADMLGDSTDTDFVAMTISDKTKMANSFDFGADSVGYDGSVGEIVNQTGGGTTANPDAFGALFISDGTFNGLNNIGKIEVWQTSPTTPDSNNTMSFSYGNDVDNVIFSAGNPSAVGEDYGFTYKPTAGVTPALFTISFDSFKVDSDVESVRIIQDQSKVNESLVLSDLTFLRSVGGVNIKTFEAAQEAMYAVIDAMNQIDEARADLGAIQNRVIHANNNNENIRVNVTEATSRIKDLDFASESTQLAKFQVLQQTGAAMLVQANQITQIAISLVRGG